MITTRSVVAFTIMLAGAASAVAAPEPPRTGGCQCPSGAEQLLDHVDHVFIGDLIEVKDAGDDPGSAVIRVRENFKGQLTGVVEVHDAVSAQCSWAVFEMATPGRYVIFANVDEGELVTPAFCPQTQPLSGLMAQLAPFRAYARAHRAPMATGGRAAAAKPSKAAAAPKAGS